MKKIFNLLIFISLNLFAGERIVTLSPSLNEIVFALGSGKDIVANVLYCDYPEESKKIPKIGGYASISLEKLLLSKPTLIFTQDYDKKFISNIKKLGLNFYSFKLNNLNSIKSTIKSIGDILSKKKRASKLIEDINNSLKGLQNIVKDKTFMIVFSPTIDLNRNIYIAGNSSYFNDIIKFSGNSNAYKTSSFAQPVVNIEKIINMNPDVIVFLAPYMSKKSALKKQLFQTWKTLPIKASKKGNIYIIDKEYAGIPSNRVVNFIDDFKKILQDVRN